MMTKMKIALVLCGSLLVGGVAAAQDNGGVDPIDRSAKRAEMKKQRLAKFDVNNDGKLDKTERAAMRDAMATIAFTKLDTDRNGVLSLAEFKAGKHKMGKRHARFGKRMKHGTDTK